ncbi:hypothetical protein [uncultured Paenibacillus sp.]|uniref:hypothetical protein n=1 Tax=uncultured Paenibacillus sp. TaxID=227322 RepID=UPI0028D8251A|nr:hypothetical protein [uncultured Paenibacillus sp.]
MSRRDAERLVKLDLIASVAQSQRALARLLENVADVSGVSPFAARSIADNIRLLSGLQQSMAEAVAGIRLREIRAGRPGTPWLAPFVSVDASGAGRQTPGGNRD